MGREWDHTLPAVEGQSAYGEEEEVNCLLFGSDLCRRAIDFFKKGYLRFDKGECAAGV